MPRVGSTNRAFRMDDITIWERFGELAEPDRSEVLRRFIRWYVRDEGARLPKRPDSASRSSEGDQATDPGHSPM